MVPQWGGRHDDVALPWHLFPLPIVRSQLLKRRTLSDHPELPGAGRGLDIQLERLPYCMGGAYRAVMEVRQLLAAAVSAHQEEFARSKANQMILGQGETLFIRNAVDSYLDVSCRAQDAVLAYVSTTFYRSLRQSLSRYVKALKNGKVFSHPEIEAALSEYWSKTGRRLRQYRDLAQHHAVVASEGTLVMRSDGLIEVALLLPTDPSVKAPKDWTYRSPAVPAYIFCEQSYLDLFSFVYRVLFILARHLGYPESFRRLVTFRAPIGAGPLPSHGVPSPEDLPSRLSEIRKDLKSDCQAKYGPIADPPKALDG